MKNQMKCKSALLLLLISCTPFEREVVEEVIHEAVVAEQAIEQDLENQNGRSDKESQETH